PLPARLEWRADEVRAVIASAQEVLGSPGWTLDADVGFFRGLTLLPSAMKAARDPDGRTLREVVPPDLYARWEVLKQRHIGRDNGVEKDRPLVAAGQLYAAALKDVGLGRSSPVSKVVEKASKAHGLTPVSTRVTIKIADPRQALKEVRGTALQDVECFRRTLDVVEHGLPLLAERANAWSVGDIAALERLAVKGQYLACVDAVATSDFGRRRGLADVDAQAHRKWMDMASDALRRNAVTFATVPVTSLVTPGGYADQLRVRGYEVMVPE
ncbi:MAG: TraB/GumN family protein, partial [Stenotrophomonas maltophilia]